MPPQSPSHLTSRSVTRTLILGGARSGKSTEAETRITALIEATDAPVLYVATGGTREDDGDWAERVAQHQARRPAAWRTSETTDLPAVLAAASGPVLIDCLTLWLTAAMDVVGAWDEATWHASGRAALATRFDELLDAWASTRVPVIAVSNEVGWGVVPETPAGRRFRDEQGRLNQRIAAASDSVVLMVAGLAVTVR